MSGFVERSFLERVVTGGEGASGSLSVDPLWDLVDDFLTGDVVADEVDKLTFASGKDFLEGLEDELVDEEMVHGREVCAEGHVVEVSVSFGSSEGRVDEFFVTGWVGNVPLFEVGFESFELTLRQVIAKAARSTVGEEGDLVVLEAEGFGCTLGFWSLFDGDLFGFTEMVSATVGAELLSLAEETVVVALAEHLCETLFERGDGSIVRKVRGVLATICPVSGDTEGFADFF